jgi:hypothetical protein
MNNLNLEIEKNFFTSIISALLSLRPGAQFVVRGTSYDGIEWNEPPVWEGGQKKPTREEVESKIEELKAAEPMRLLRIERDRLISETDWWVLPDRTPTPEQLSYRQELRDLPDIASPILDFTNRLGISGVDWPVKPQ